ncbi:MAG TPA: response regulator [Rhodocyclaceae bacterium]|nr:response regulator [Rhodocyclaceae bacterium]
MNTTVYIVDDDPDLRDALALLMRAAGLKAECFAGGREFLQRCTQPVAGCLVLDIRMPGMDGIALQAELRKRRIGLPIVFLTGHGDVPLAVQALKAGAFDFIQKPLDEHRLVMAVMSAQKAFAGQQLLAVDRADGETVSAERLESLSGREREVLRLLLAGRASREIAEALCISVKTVEFHRANIREKLGVASNHELLARLAGARHDG